MGFRGRKCKPALLELLADAMGSLLKPEYSLSFLAEYSLHSDVFRLGCI